MKTLRFAYLLLCTAFMMVINELPAASEEKPTTVSVDSNRVDEIERMLSDSLNDRSESSSRSISNRAAWEALSKKPGYADKVSKAEELLGKPLPEQTDELYLEFSKNGNRTRFQNVAFARRGRLTTLVIAECVENKGRFLPAIEELITTLCGERTWVLPAHDSRLDNFHGRQITIDLFSSAFAWSLAETDVLLGEKLASGVRELIRDRVHHFVLKPYLDMVRGQRRADGWFFTTNNWNSVCLAGCVGAGLIMLDSPREKAEAIAAAEKYSMNLLDGFPEDGYCTEGLGYWNYGFRNYVFLAEMIRDATGGKLDLLARPEARMPATFGARIQMINGIAPAFADCSIHAHPDSTLMWLLNRRFGFGLKPYEELNWTATLSTVAEAMMYAFTATDTLTYTPPFPMSAAADARTWFDKAGILICRPAPDTVEFAAAMKGGNNAEHHNHNDLGSYVVVVGNKPVLLDPGNETYTKRTFSSKRYDSKLLNSYGHPVPVVDGKLQRKGAEAEAKIVSTSFTDKADRLLIDIASAYEVPALKSLNREFCYARGEKPSFTITDSVEFTSATAFGTAMITLGKVVDETSDTLTIREGKQTLKVAVDTGGIPYSIKQETIKENAPVEPVRIGIDLLEPVTTARVKLQITP